MNEHLQLATEFRQTNSLPLAKNGSPRHLSDMDIVQNQALLMAAGSEVFLAIKHGEMEAILSGLVYLAYSALEAIAMQGEDVKELPETWRHDGFVLSVMRILSEKIHACTSGNAADYSEIYCLCEHLTRSFINADFDKAVRRYHDAKMQQTDIPDLSDCLFE